jgi:SAM-dependent methyltransferase
MGSEKFRVRSDNRALTSYVGNLFQNIKPFMMNPLDRSVEVFICRFSRFSEIQRYLDSTHNTCLHIGCGSRNFPGWLNTDFFQSARTYIKSDPKILPLDIRDKLPFDDESFNFVYSEHVHEHISYREGFELCKEIKRILKPNGVFRVSTPNVDLLFQLLHRPLSQEEVPVFERGCDLLAVVNGEEPKSPISLLNRIIGEPLHKYCYNAETLIEQLNAAGFSSISEVCPGESTYEALRNLENSLYGRKPDPVLLKFALWHTLSGEGKK